MLTIFAFAYELFFLHINIISKQIFLRTTRNNESNESYESNESKKRTKATKSNESDESDDTNEFSFRLSVNCECALGYWLR